MTALECACCGRVLNPATAVWLLLRTSTGTYHPTDVEAEWIGTDDDQGEFPFGAGCARRILRDGGRP